MSPKTDLLKTLPLGEDLETLIAVLTCSWVKQSFWPVTTDCRPLSPLFT